MGCRAGEALSIAFDSVYQHCCSLTDSHIRMFSVQTLKFWVLAVKARLQAEDVSVCSCA